MARTYRSILPRLAFAFLAAGFFAVPASAQFTGGGQTGGGNTNVNRNAGLTQSGQVEASGAVARTQESFVGSSTGGVSHPLSVAASNGADGLSNFGSVTGFNPNGSAGALGGSTGGIGGALGGLTGGFGGGGGQFGNTSQFGGNQFGNTNQFGATGANGANGQTTIPVRMAIGFTTVRPGSVVVAQRLQDRFTQIPALKNAVNITVVMEGSTAVLSGTAVSAREQDLAGRLAMLEPGVDLVRNEVRLVEETDEP
jgi:hypothetical protein